MIFNESELILNNDGSIYHLNLLPSDIANTIITVGDPDRVCNVSKYFDTIEIQKQKREFKTVTGTINKKRITVISTGIGTDNIDIVLNELDALVNIDFSKRKSKEKHQILDIIRIGTSGSISKHIPVDSFLISNEAIGFDSLLHFYESKHIQNLDFSNELVNHLNWNAEKSTPYVVSCDTSLANQFKSIQIKEGITVTNVGFYGPQSRELRLKTSDKNLIPKLINFQYQEKYITNLEMETAGIYGLSKLLGHRAVSINAILANRITGDFSKNPSKLVDDLIVYCLNKLTI